MEKTTEKIYSILTRPDVCREWPNNYPGVAERIEAAVNGGFPLELLGLWGGYKESTSGVSDRADIVAMNRLSETSQRVKQYFSPGLLINLLFCDTSHVSVNGRSLEETEKYRKTLIPLADERGFKVKKLSDYYGSDGSTLPSGSANYSRFATIKTDEFASQLSKRAAKHSVRVSRGEDPLKIAKEYAEMEAAFTGLLHSHHPSAVFFSYSDPKAQSPIADINSLPMLFFYALKRGWGDVPWYLDEETMNRKLGV